MSTLPKIVVVVPFHNRKEFTFRFIQSFSVVTMDNLEFVFFDDGSTDGSSKMVKKELPNAHILHGDGTFFWTRSVNRGIEFALSLKPDFVLTMNNDVEVTPPFLEILVQSAISRSPALVHPKVFYKEEPGRLFYGGGELKWGKGHMCHMRPLGDFDSGQYSEAREVDFLPGMSMLIPISCFTSIGLFDEKRFPHYFADHDFSMRAKNVGYRLVFEPNAVIYNFGKSTGVIGTQKPVSYRTLIPSFFSIRSPWNFPSNFRFHLRHCPVYLIPYSLIRFYLWAYSYMYLRRKLREFLKRTTLE